MKTYPSIEYYNKGFFRDTVYAFDKLDGSNIRAEWSRKRGWYKFGTKKEMISEKSENFGDAVPIFLNKYGDDLEGVFRKKYSNVQNVVIFGEYLGDNSFSGQHDINDKKDIVLFDVNIYKKGLIPPRDFFDNFGHLHIPDLIYKGVYDEDLIKEIRDNTELKEGVICKGVRKTKGSEIVWMTKIKTSIWLNKVRSLYGEKALFDELNKDDSLFIDY